MNYSFKYKSASRSLGNIIDMVIIVKLFRDSQPQCRPKLDKGFIQVQVQVQDLIVTYTIIQRVLTSSEM